MPEIKTPQMLRDAAKSKRQQAIEIKMKLDRMQPIKLIELVGEIYRLLTEAIDLEQAAADLEAKALPGETA